MTLLFKPDNKYLILFLLVVVSCESRQSYHPVGLQKLEEGELIARARAGRFPGDIDKIVFKDSVGNVLSKPDLDNLDRDQFTGDQYVNANGDIIEIVVRRSTNADRALQQKIMTAAKEGEPVNIIDVDCAEAREMLETVFRFDQDSRKEGAVGDYNIDRENQQKVASIIERCGFPTVEKHGHESVQAAFLVIQHAPAALRAKYFPVIKESADRGDLTWSTVALMEDRMLMDIGEKQKYGSQVQKLIGTDKWTVYPIDDVANVNKRRAEVGLEPIEDYLKRFDINFTGE